jgi:hypothetical protein
MTENVNVLYNEIANPPRSAVSLRPVAAMQLVFEQLTADGKAVSDKATTWVCTTSNVTLPYSGEALADAVSKGIAVGLHLESRSLVVHFPQPEPAQGAKRKLQTILGKGGAARRCIDGAESLDLFHAESWGMVHVKSPEMPDVFDRLIEEDDASSDSAPEHEGVAPELEEDKPVQAANAMVPESPCLFNLALPTEPQDIRVRSLLDALTTSLETESNEEQALRRDMEETGGAITPFLEKALFTSMRGTKDEVHRIQEQDRALARKESTACPIFWLSPAPHSITVSAKPNMHLARRVAWIVWKASTLNVKLTLPMFMALFKQISGYTNPVGRLTQYKAMVAKWQGRDLDWKGLDAETRNLIRNINEDKIDCYCLNCKRVLDPRSEKFCSLACASQWCRCGEKLCTREVTDHDALEVQQNRLGNYGQLVHLAGMLELKPEVESFDACEFDKLREQHITENCCRPNPVFVNLACKKYVASFARLNRIQRCQSSIAKGNFTWGHCHVAQQQLQKIADLPIPTRSEQFCATCEPARKKQRRC